MIPVSNHKHPKTFKQAGLPTAVVSLETLNSQSFQVVMVNEKASQRVPVDEFSFLSGRSSRST